MMGFESFRRAVQKGQLKEVKTGLLECPGYSDWPDAFGKTSLHIAAKSGHESIVKLLLENNSRAFNYLDCFKRTPFHNASKNGHDSIIKLLLLYGDCHIESPDYYGNTSLHAAAENGHESTVKLLLRASAACPPMPEICLRTSLNSKNVDGWTPLHSAIRKGHDPIVKILLQQSEILIDLPDKHGMTPLHLAASYYRNSTVRILKAVGATVSSFILLSRSQVRLIQEPMPAEEILEIRFQIYFCRSLLSRLLF